MTKCLINYCKKERQAFFTISEFLLGFLKLFCAGLNNTIKQFIMFIIPVNVVFVHGYQVFFTFFAAIFLMHNGFHNGMTYIAYMHTWIQDTYTNYISSDNLTN